LSMDRHGGRSQGRGKRDWSYFQESLQVRRLESKKQNKCTSVLLREELKGEKPGFLRLKLKEMFGLEGGHRTKACRSRVIGGGRKAFLEDTWRGDKDKGARKWGGGNKKLFFLN